MRVVRFFTEKKRRIVFCSIIAVVAALNIAAWNSTAFCDWYLAHIFPIWVNTYGRVTGLFPFSVGEWMILLGVCLVVSAVLLPLILLFMKLFTRNGSKKQKNSQEGNTADGTGQPFRRKGFDRFVKGYLTVFVWILAAVSLVMTLNCFILYHASTFSSMYFPAAKTEYSSEELLTVYNLVAEKCNELYVKVDRDADGLPCYSGDMGAEVIACMQKLGKNYPRLAGWYPRPKAMFFSDFMCQQYMQGYYFPFSMEANYNDVMTQVRKPFTMAHELGHLRGYIFEDEANFIGYLACKESEVDFVQYSGYQTAFSYLYQDVVKLYKKDPEGFEALTEKIPLVKVSQQIFADNIFVTDAEWERINGKALIDTEVVDKAADVFIETNLKVNGVSDGKISYSRMVLLLLQYYNN